MSCIYCEHCTAAEAASAELRFRRRTRYLTYAIEQRMCRISVEVVPRDGESMDSYLDRLYELAK